MVFEDGDAAVEAAPAQSLENHHCAGVGILLQQLINGGVKRLSLLVRLGWGRGCAGWMRYLATVRRLRFKCCAICRSDHFWCQ